MEDRQKPIFVISDLHMGDGGPRDNFAHYGGSKQLNLFLDFVASQNGELFILGDLFEFWQCSLGAIFTKNRELLNRLGQMDVIYVIGNHDVDLQALIGTDLLTHPLLGKMSLPFERRIGDKTFRFMHGHEVDKFNSDESPSWGRMITIFAGILEQRVGKPVLPNGETVEKTAETTGTWMLSLWNLLAKCSSKLLRKKEEAGPREQLTPAQNPDRMQEMMDKYKEDKETRGYDVAIVGHTHEPRREGDWYVNSGAWVDGTNTFLRISLEGVVEMFCWADGKQVAWTASEKETKGGHPKTIAAGICALVLLIVAIIWPNAPAAPPMLPSPASAPATNTSPSSNRIQLRAAPATPRIGQPKSSAAKDAAMENPQ